MAETGWPMVRIAQLLLVGQVGLFALSVAWNNIADPRTNFEFVRHVLSMDTVHPQSRLRSRAIHADWFHRLAFVMVVLAEALVALLCLSGAASMGMALGAPAPAFEAAKVAAYAGLLLGFCVWFGGFMIAGGQWFASWQSERWNGRQSAFMFYTAIGIALVVLMHPA